MNAEPLPKQRVQPARMRAAVISAPGRFVVEEVAIPEPGPRQVRVKLEGCGVCGSNLPPFEGRSWFNYPLAGGDSRA